MGIPAVSAAMCHRFKTYSYRLVLGAAAVLSLLLTSGLAFAGNTRAQEKTARKACLIGDYKQGVSILADLFVETGKTVHIFNQGRCYEQNRRYEDAVAKFEEFLRATKGKASEEERAEAEQHIADCNERLRKERNESPTQPPSTPAPVVVPTPEPKPVASSAMPEPAAVAAQPAARPEAGERRWGLLTAGIVTGALGAGGVVAGVIYNLKANDAARKVETDVGAYPASSKDQKDFKTYAWIGYSAGAACLAAGAVMVAFGIVRSSPESSAGIAFVPTLGPGQMGATLKGAF